jgi:hypothetical protein
MRNMTERAIMTLCYTWRRKYHILHARIYLKDFGYLPLKKMIKP